MSTIDPDTINTGNPVQGNATTASVRANEVATKDNFTAAKTDIEALETPTTPYLAVDGTEALPGMAFASEPSSGRRLEAAGDMRDAVAGADVVALTSAGMAVTGDVSATEQLLGDASAATVLATGAISARPLDEFFLAADREVFIPTDYATLQEAVDGEAHWIVKAGVKITITIETGHTLTAGLFLTSGRWDHFRIESVDAEVLLDPSWPAATNVIEGRNARLPVLDCLINGQGTEGLNGYVCTNNTSGRVAPGAGVRNLDAAAGGIGLLITDGSSCDAEDCIFNDNPINVHVLSASQLSANLETTGADFSGASGANGVRIDGGSNASIKGANISGYTGTGSALRCSESNVDADSVDCSGATAGDACFITACAGVNLTNADLSNASFGTNVALHIAKSQVLAAGTDCSGAGGDAIFVEDASVVSLGATTKVDNAGGNGITVQASRVNLNGMTITNPTAHGVDASEASTISGAGCTITTPGSDGVSSVGSMCDVTTAIITTPGRYGVFADDCSNVNAKDIGITNPVTAGILAKYGSTVNCRDGSITGHPAGLAIEVQTGASVSSAGCTTDNSPPVPDIADCSVAAFNVLDANNGIIWAQ